ncbi:MAG TPA: fibronectin/fibrinogen-binding protein [Firmicutes bacterium]|nr:fibronectin/fibrinogen-binding protein [Bacillota bacterium]
MAFDAAMLSALEPELHALCGSRILKVYQPTRLELVLTLRHERENVRLLVSAHPERARLHLTTRTQPNPAVPPAFCMYLRRHLEGARLVGIRRPPAERIIGLRFEGRDELGERQDLELIAEIMGKHSNIILVNTKSGLILEAIKHVTEEINRFREVLPGLPYRNPPAQDRVPPAELTELAFYSALQARGKAVVPALVGTLSGFSPLLAREVAARAGVDERQNVRQATRAELGRLWHALEEVYATLTNGAWRPTVYFTPEGRVLEVAPFPLVLFAGMAAQGFSTASAALDCFYGRREEEELISTTRHNLLAVVTRARERAEKKLGLHLEALEQAGAAEAYRRFGELLFAYGQNVPPGATEFEAEDWESGARLRIPLDPRLTPGQNAQAYLRRFTKAKKTLSAAREQAMHDREELAYLESLALALEEARDLTDLEEIHLELEKEGYVKRPAPARHGAAPRAPRSEPWSFLSTDGWTILVGRNNRQNDRLTLRLARPHDLWLHAQNIPGSHVVVRCPEGREPPETTLYQAALLAAYHSRARLSSRVPVDYTRCRHVRKPAGARPGFVIYDHQRTLYVTPSAENLKALQSVSS